ncbi:hypothetical protein VE26_16825 [Devosia chinhatensis]|uniref:Uncharacterized protein n=1 Tax=Devosia chinhatensis TaxID=429727 RepID=A0A0F5FDI0_9HYPH|nr:hypothetical protein VE26_16825 [Devosia chinhatensis]
MLASGDPIGVMNLIRSQFSTIKGGRAGRGQPTARRRRQERGDAERDKSEEEIVGSQAGDELHEGAGR